MLQKFHADNSVNKQIGNKVPESNSKVPAKCQQSASQVSVKAKRLISKYLEAKQPCTAHMFGKELIDGG